MKAENMKLFFVLTQRKFSPGKKIGPKRKKKNNQTKTKYLFLSKFSQNVALGAHSSAFLEQKKLYLNAIQINDQYEQRIIRILVSFVYYFPSISTRKIFNKELLENKGALTTELKKLIKT